MLLSRGAAYLSPAKGEECAAFVEILEGRVGSRRTITKPMAIQTIPSLDNMFAETVSDGSTTSLLVTSPASGISKPSNRSTPQPVN